MWKKLALLAAIASAVMQAVRYWNEASVKNAARTGARRKQPSRHEVQRWEDEGGNLPASSETGSRSGAESAAGPSPARARTRAGTGSASRAGRGPASSASA